MTNPRRDGSRSVMRGSQLQIGVCAQPPRHLTRCSALSSMLDNAWCFAHAADPRREARAAPRGRRSRRVALPPDTRAGLGVAAARWVALLPDIRAQGLAWRQGTCSRTRAVLPMRAGLGVAEGNLLPDTDCHAARETEVSASIIEQGSSSKCCLARETGAW